MNNDKIENPGTPVPEASFESGLGGVDITGQAFWHDYCELDGCDDMQALCADMAAIAADFNKAMGIAVKENAKQ